MQSKFEKNSAISSNDEDEKNDGGTSIVI